MDNQAEQKFMDERKKLFFDAAKKFAQASEPFREAGSGEKEITVDHIKEYFSAKIQSDQAAKAAYADTVTSKEIYDNQISRWTRGWKELDNPGQEPTTALSLLAEEWVRSVRHIGEFELDRDEVMKGESKDWNFKDTPRTEITSILERNITHEEKLAKGYDQARNLLRETYATTPNLDENEFKEMEKAYNEGAAIAAARLTKQSS